LTKTQKIVVLTAAAFVISKKKSAKAKGGQK